MLRVAKSSHHARTAKAVSGGGGKGRGTMNSHTVCVLYGCSITEIVYVQESAASAKPLPDGRIMMPGHIQL